MKTRSDRFRILSFTLVLSLATSPMHFVDTRSAWAADDREAAAEAAEAGIAAYNSGKYDEAIRKLSAAQAVVPDNSAVQLYLGLAYLKQDRLADTVEVWETYLGLPPSTDTEEDAELKAKVRRYLTLVTREENQRAAKAAIAREAGLGAPDASTVAVSYFRNLGGADLAPLRKGMAALLIADFAKVPGLKVVERERLQALVDEMALSGKGLTTADTAPRMGRLLGAGRVATGTYAEPEKDDLVVDTLVADTSTAKTVATQEASGPVQEFWEVENLLAIEILAGLGFSQARLASLGVLDQIRTPQTTSLGAFQAFSRGLDAKDRQDYATARTEFETALKEDPNFDLAREELLALPLAAVSLASVGSSLTAAAPTAAVTAASIAGGLSTTTLVAVGAGVLAAVGIGLGVGVGTSGGGGGDGGGGSGETPPCQGAGSDCNTPGSQGACGAREVCTESGDVCRCEAAPAVCGNGTVEDGEVCDGSDIGGATCADAGTGCTGPVGCAADCRSLDLSACACPGCGNGTLDPDEDCDGANPGSGTCESLGFTGGQLGCDMQCNYDTAGCTRCDGSLDAGEVCDGPGSCPTGQVCASDCSACEQVPPCDAWTVSAGSLCDCFEEDGGVRCCWDTTLDNRGCQTPFTLGDATVSCDGTEVSATTRFPTPVGPGDTETQTQCVVFGLDDACDALQIEARDAVGRTVTSVPVSCDFQEVVTCIPDGEIEPGIGEECDPDACLGEGAGNGCGDFQPCSIDSCVCEPSTCGNGVLDEPVGCALPAEVCDGTELGGATCASEGFTEGTIGCTSDCALDTSLCTTCGDDTVEGSEVCDGSDLGDVTTCADLPGFGSDATGLPTCESDCGGYDDTGCAECGNGDFEVGEACETTFEGTQGCESAENCQNCNLCVQCLAFETVDCDKIEEDNGYLYSPDFYSMVTWTLDNACLDSVASAVVTATCTDDDGFSISGSAGALTGGPIDLFPDDSDGLFDEDDACSGPVTVGLVINGRTLDTETLTCEIL